MHQLKDSITILHKEWTPFIEKTKIPERKQKSLCFSDSEKNS